MVLKKETESFVRASGHLQEDAKGNVFIKGFTAPNRMEKVDTTGMVNSTKIAGLTARWVVEQDTDLGNGDQFYEKKISMFNELDKDNVSIPQSTIRQIGANPYSEPRHDGGISGVGDWIKLKFQEHENTDNQQKEDLREHKKENNLHHILLAVLLAIVLVGTVIALTKLFGG